MPTQGHGYVPIKLRLQITGAAEFGPAVIV